MSLEQDGDHQSLLLLRTFSIVLLSEFRLQLKRLRIQDFANQFAQFLMAFRVGTFT